MVRPSRTDEMTREVMTQRLMLGFGTGRKGVLNVTFWASGVLKLGQSPPLERARGKEAW
jgi:hypothetical protein